MHVPMVVSSMSTCSYFCSFVKNLFIGDDKQIFQVKKKKNQCSKKTVFAITNLCTGFLCLRQSGRHFSLIEVLSRDGSEFRFAIFLARILWKMENETRF